MRILSVCAVLLSVCALASAEDAGSRVTFRDITARAGLHFTHNNAAFGKKYLPETMGPGCAFIDYDNDGWPDILLVNAEDWPGHKKTNSTLKLYHNNRDGTFTDATAKAGLAVSMFGMGVAVGDYDNDGFDDIFVTAMGQSRLFHNNGNGTFTDVTKSAGLWGPNEFSTSAAWVDFDRDGKLDLVVANYVQWSLDNDLYCTLDGAHKSYCTPESYKGSSARLWHNLGNGKFEDVTRKAGMYDASSKSLGVAILDYDGDGWPDILLANDTQPNKLYLNKRDGTFEERGVPAGIGFSEDGIARAAMGVDVGDYDRSGRPSIIISNFSNQMLSLYHNEGNGLFVDEAPRSEVGRATLVTLGFGCFFFDYDNDGWPDIFVADGHIENDIERVQKRVTYAEPPHLFRNLGHGKFEEVTKTAGPAFAAPRVARGAAYADIDNDGFLDVLVTTNGGPAYLFHNEGGTNHSLRVRLRGTKSNRDGIGAVVRVVSGDDKQWQMLRSGSSYLSQSELVLTFGLGSRTKVDALEVQWPSGALTKVQNINADQTVTIDEDKGIVATRAYGKRTAPVRTAAGALKCRLMLSRKKQCHPERGRGASSRARVEGPRGFLGAAWLSQGALTVAFFTCLLVPSLVVSQTTPEKGSSPDRLAEAARLNNLGAAYMNQQLFEKALQKFREATAADPNLSQAQVNQGIALLNLQRIEPARELLEQAAKREPKNPYVWYNLGLLYKNAGDTQPTLDAFTHAAEIDPNDADTWYFIGSVRLQARQFAEAIAAFEKAISMAPFHASAQFGISRAYQQSGNTDEARKHLVRFQQITQTKIGVPISLAYGEQGKYSRAEESPAAPRSVPPAIKVAFIDVTAEAGLANKVTGPRSNGFGAGACFLDYDGDGRADFFLASGGKQGGMTLYHNVGGGKFVDVTRAAGLDPTLAAIACAAGDYDNDGSVDLAVATKDHGVLLFHNEKNGTFKSVGAQAGISPKGYIDPAGLTWVDYDHDGDFDLYVFSSLVPISGCGTNIMWRNNGNGTFTDVTADRNLGDGASSAAVPTDYNNDRAIDILVAGAEPLIFENPREGSFITRRFWKGQPPTIAAAVFDFNKDGWMDVAFTHSSAPALSLWRNVNGRSFERVPLPDPYWVKAFGVVALDYDNDGWIDFAAVGETASGRGEVRLFRNLGPDGFKDVTADVGLDKLDLHSPRALAAADYDGDGATDLLITQIGPPVLLHNQGGNQNHWLRIALKGLNDNKSAIGTKVEVFAGGNRQKFEIAGAGYFGQSSTDLVVGLGQSKDADIVRMLWPTGVLQDEIEVAGNRQQSFIEIDRRGSSCPTLFVWEGKHYELVSDMLGAGVVGHWVAPGERNIPRPTEYVKVDRRVIQSRDGLLSFRLMEPMEEVVYLDKVELLAVDHPSYVDVFPNEYFASNPPYPPFKVVVSRNARPPAGAWDEHGHNVLPDLLAKRYFGDFELTSFKGFTKLHTLELDLGEPYRGGPLRLLLDGEIEYFTATGMYAADQAGIHGIAPYVDALDQNGKWVRVTDDMGFPAGLPRTMVADLSDRLPLGAQRIRITTNLQIYWNQILIDRTEQNFPTRLHSVPLQRADLRFHGYPRQIEDKPPGNVKYVYEKVSGTGPYGRQAGTYTRYGDVAKLLSDFDDRLVVFGSGEEVALDFNPASLPALPAGWTRDYFFLANGYEKDWDFYAADASTVDPLPFREMSVYPPKQSFPLDDEHLNYMLEYNTRYISGDEPRGYWYEFNNEKE